MHTLWMPSSSRFRSLARTHALYGHSLHGFYCLNHTLSAFFDSSSFEFYRILVLHCTRSNGNGIIFCHIRAYLVGNAKVCKKDILSHPGIYCNEEFEHDNMFGYDILCRALNRNILSHHALPQNIVNIPGCCKQSRFIKFFVISTRADRLRAVGPFVRLSSRDWYRHTSPVLQPYVQHTTPWSLDWTTHSFSTFV